MARLFKMKDFILLFSFLAVVVYALFVRQRFRLLKFSFGYVLLWLSDGITTKPTICSMVACRFGAKIIA